MRIFCLSIFFLIFLLSCSANDKAERLKDTAIKIKIDSTNYAISLYDISKAIDFEEIPRTVPYDSIQTKKYADLILKDSIVVLHSFKPQYIPLEKITWTENPLNNKTWQAYYENLFFVSILNHTYHSYGAKQYHEKAKAYVLSYVKAHNSLAEKTSDQTWEEGAIGHRTGHLMQTIYNELQQDNPDTEFIQKVFDHISLNATFMLDPAHYEQNNHSLIMDRSLLALAKITKSNPSLHAAIYEPTVARALKNIDYIIDDSGLAKEHATTYHIYNHNLDRKIIELIEKEDINPAFQLKLLKKNDVLLQLVKPDLTFPIWGDSGIEFLNAHLAESFGNDQRVLNVMAGKRLPSMVNFENNIATLRTQADDSSYVALFANYYSRTHKHNDDLQFIFQTLGVDILTDQGYYGYEDTHRPFLMSVFAHNSIAINDSDYVLGKEGQYSKLTEYLRSDDIEIVSGEHTMYDSIIVKRKLYFIKPNVIVLQDWAESKDANRVKSISQQFNFGEKANLDVAISENSATVLFPKNIKAIVKSFTDHDKITTKEVSRSRIQYSIIPIPQVKVRKEGDRLTTVIEVQSDLYKNAVSNIQIKDGIIHFSKDGKKFNLAL
ncbi:heparinase II/III family protein [Aequorivita todarodis]|uniref:heparinase II/III domain-containing protein n=1 Tax=Aequorivita todarodis TaxID=2036821 RepID=UPI0023500C16|nr:heparinase II/III family protein [Aequorivita todarodis]MDC8002349.1 heparinase II/III family protein [Aequorivita todarodis]